MAERNQWHRLFGVFLGSVLAAGIAGANMACEVDEGELEGGVQANSKNVVEAESPRHSDRDAGYVFVDVGAWDDTKSELPVFLPMPEAVPAGQHGYKFLDVGAWDDTNLTWPAVDREVAAEMSDSGGYKFFDVGAWDDTDIDWP